MDRERPGAHGRVPSGGNSAIVYFACDAGAVEEGPAAALADNPSVRASHLGGA